MSFHHKLTWFANPEQRLSHLPGHGRGQFLNRFDHLLDPVRLQLRHYPTQGALGHVGPPTAPRVPPVRHASVPSNVLNVGTRQQFSGEIMFLWPQEMRSRWITVWQFRDFISAVTLEIKGIYEKSHEDICKLRELACGFVRLF